MNRIYKLLMLSSVLMFSTSAFAQSDIDDSSTVRQSDRMQPPRGDQPISPAGTSLSRSIDAASAMSPREQPRPCPLRDEGEGEGEGEPEAMGSAVGGNRAAGFTRHLVPIGAAILVIAYAVSGARPQLRRRRKAVILTILAALAVGNYIDFGQWTRDRYVNGWEFFHYYLGSKYALELGYTELYAAALVADEETGRKFTHEKDSIRDLTGGRCARVVDVLRQRDRIVARFSPQRWMDFTQDVVYFKSVLSQSQWNTIFHDKGFNATPVWSMIVGRLTNWIETSDSIGLLGLSLIDPLLIAFAIFAVWRTFDYRSALLMIILI
ncbi:MAG: hypothetical protein IH987_13865, partial [Planctomycetes bacterium]|nr:hypothetical protein [Planctomycetota bacterium]